MKTYKKLFFAFILLFTVLFFCFSKDTYSQNLTSDRQNYESLYNTIKAGNVASIIKTVWIEEFSLVEKSLITITPISFPDTSYKVMFEVIGLEKGSNENSYESGSVLGFMIADCKAVGEKYENFINTSCWLFAETTEDARDIVKSGITRAVDEKYLIDGDLVGVYTKICKPDEHHQVVKKPAVYLYPPETMNIKVNVEVNGQLTLTEPPYNTGWNVNATTDGLIDNKYDYLFYEADLKKIELPEEGWIVEYKNIENWFDKYLPEFGLNTKEKEQFKEYWLKNLKKANYYEIKLLDYKFLEENMKLVISPEPQTLIRLNFYFKPLFEKKEISEPVILKKERKGFTVVEWGGINAGEIKIIP
jgi:hypothetical protein